MDLCNPSMPWIYAKHIAHHAPSCSSHAHNSSFLGSKSMILRVKPFKWPRKPPVMGKTSGKDTSTCYLYKFYMQWLTQPGAQRLILGSKRNIWNRLPGNQKYSKSCSGQTEHVTDPPEFPWCSASHTTRPEFQLHTSWVSSSTHTHQACKHTRSSSLCPTSSSSSLCPTSIPNSRNMEATR